jgi:hypothetical protein
MIRPATAVLSFTLSACASIHIAPANELSTEHRRILDAALVYMSHEFESDRPVFVLTSTDSWMPRPEEMTQPRPADIPEEIWEQVKTGPFPEGLRDVNKEEYVVGGLRLPPRFRLYGAEAFDKLWESTTDLAALESTLGSRAPLVLSYSRPFVSADGKEAFVVEHVLSSWSGCGGINVLRVKRSSGTWRAVRYESLVTW